MTKFYCYIDETGQDTKGKLFLVTVVIMGKERDLLERKLEKAERVSGKKYLKWRKSSFKARIDYLKLLFQFKELSGKISYSHYEDTKDYVNLTILATAKAILQKVSRDYQIIVLVDGLRRKERVRFTKGLRDLKIKVDKTRGIRREESNALIRLADSVCGVARDYFEGQKYAKEFMEKAKKQKLIQEI